MAKQDWIDPEAFRLLLLNVRWLRGWTQKQLAEAAGVDETTVGRYEKGRVPARQDAVKLFAAAALDRLEVTLLPGLRAARKGPHRVPPAATEADPSRFMGSLEATIEAGRTLLAAGLPGEYEDDTSPGEVGAERGTAGRLWALLAPCSPHERRVLVEWLPAFHSWPAVERLSWESEREEANDPDAALRLAELARRAAERMSVGPERSRALGYAWAYVGNALRVKNDHHESCQAFARAWILWREGVAAIDLPLEEWRLRDLEASLLIDSRQLDSALDNLRRALGEAPQEATGGLLLSRGRAWGQKGEPEKALADLDEAAQRIDEKWAPRHILVLQFNRVVNLCRLGRYEAASRLLPEVRSRVDELGTELDLVRTLWLEGTVLAGLGRAEEGLAALAQVEEEMRRRGMAFDGALVNLDIAEIELAQGRTAEVQRRAVAMWWIFRSKGVDREALAALRMFCEAAKAEAATVELVRRAKESLEAARREPGPRFEG
jgi:transcriptional regulator with XRE-family HTH domain